MFRTTIFTLSATAALLGAAARAETLEAQKDAAVAAFAAALGGDDGALAPLFAEDGVWMPASGGRFEGAGAIARALAAIPDAQAFDVTFTDELPLGAGHILHYGTYRLTLPSEAGGATLPGEFLVVSRRTPEGLKILRHVAFAPRGRATR